MNHIQIVAIDNQISPINKELHEDQYTAYLDKVPLRPVTLISFIAVTYLCHSGAMDKILIPHHYPCKIDDMRFSNAV